MKNLYIIALVFISITSCKSDKKQAVNQNKIKEEVNSILNTWHKDAAQTNFDNYFKAMAKNSVFIGTDASENWNKTAFMKFSKPYFDKGKAWSFTSLERNIYIQKKGTIVWFDELLNTQMGICRGSGVLEKTGNQWKIKQYVLSMTIPNNDAKAIINIKKEKDSLFLQKF